MIFVMSSSRVSRVAKNIPIELQRRSTRVKNNKQTTNIIQDAKDDRTPETEIRPVTKPAKVKLEVKHERFDQIKKENLIVSNIDVIKTPQPDGHLEVDDQELDLERTLLGGQSFRWNKLEATFDNERKIIFNGIIQDTAIQIWRESSERIAFKRLTKNSLLDEDFKMTKSLLEDYFQLGYSLKELYKDWSSRDKHLAECCKQYSGFRILRQDPVENVFSFICATNNNIKRISQMIDKMSNKFGQILNYNKSDTLIEHNSLKMFPTIERLAEEDAFHCLRYELGFGYRAKFINETAKQIIKYANEENFESPRDYLLSLRKLPYVETCKRLMKFQGIGRKVADCICLMSMDHLEAVPIDCHIYEIVCKHYLPNLKKERKTLTDKVHDLIGNFFKDLHGAQDGWSTSVLFIAELKHLKQPVESESVKDSNSKVKFNKRLKLEVS